MSEQTPQIGTACEECGVPVTPDQRYCVNCGAHRRTASDPASQYFSEASAARSRVAAAASRGASKRSRRGAPGLVAAALIALVPVAAAIGITVGRSSGSNDKQVISALAKLNRTYAANAGSASNSSSTSTAGSSATGTSHLSGGQSSGNGSKKSKTTSASSKAAAKKTAKNNSSNKSGAANAPTVTSSTTAATSKQGASEAAKVAKAKGSNYIKQESSLPNSVSP